MWGHEDELFFWVFIVSTFAVVFLVLWLRWAYWFSVARAVFLLSLDQMAEAAQRVQTESPEFP